jgi:hypothetical protein
MNDSIKPTAEQLIRQTVRGLINRQADGAPDLALDAVIADMFGDADPQMVCHELMVNSIAAKIREAERQRDADLTRWVSVEQLDLWGTKPFRLPKSLLPKSAGYARDHMEQLRRMQDEKAEELLRAGRAAKDSANSMGHAVTELGALCQSIEESGLDSYEVKIEEAIQQAEAFRIGHAADAHAEAKGHMS